MLARYLSKNKLFRRITVKTRNRRTKEVIGLIKKYLPPKGKIIDIGAGSCDVVSSLINDGYKVTALDIQDLSFYDDIKPVIYDGKKIPFSNNTFDVALIVYVLHHVGDVKKMLFEARRVARQVIVVEELVPDSLLGKFLLYSWDCLINLEFFRHPHSNKTDKQWREIFKSVKLKVRKSKSSYCEWIFKTPAKTYFLERV